MLVDRILVRNGPERKRFGDRVERSLADRNPDHAPAPITLSEGATRSNASPCNRRCAPRPLLESRPMPRTGLIASADGIIFVSFLKRQGRRRSFVQEIAALMIVVKPRHQRENTLVGCPKFESASFDCGVNLAGHPRNFRRHEPIQRLFGRC
jgi:hypothetical protein